MGDVYGTYNHKEEVKGLNINLGNEKIEFKRHRDGVQPLELVEIMRRLRMEVASYIVYNERTIKA